jgi:hypothetical protein
MAALIGACLVAVPAYAAPASPVKSVVSAAPFGDSAPVIKVQRSYQEPAAQPGPQNARTGQRPASTNQRPSGPALGVVQRAGGQREGGGGQPQYNRGGGHQQHYGGGGYRGSDRYRDRDDDSGAVAAGALGGLLLGAIIANESQRNDCARRPGYDPRSHTFVGSDRRRYRCP